ncbi:M10 family metallopeptidase C-terminal domain-containing protein [Pseudoroseomonas cervicalis]|uniref:M10 family metallopeptidase C-terminal domain-containing protein n=1 Tax=Teichococcus cervicalis TaxID=204525 RepID=UPI0022F1CB28|nr:M10 family metallopeptidase C-terminal domain-containing protein [Pseudoroseomonas cervicalis]WBV41420.1 M10 family metallopeptidase C-terminal domain-containing protein [Pseudoroseomonas cervicalis]
MSVGFRVPGTGDRNIDAVLWGVRWKATELTFSFPEDTSGYSGRDENVDLSEFGVASADLVANVRLVLDTQFAAVSGLSFREVAPGEDSLMSFATLVSEPTARGTPPRYFPDDVAGNMWFNAATYASLQRGTYAAFTVLHEIGHTLGLKHGHDPGAPDAGYGVSALPLAADRDGLEFSIMTYRAAPGADADAPFDAPAGHYPVSLMMYDIAALQYLYGADYATNAGDTVYSFDPATGEMSINGVGQGASVANVVLLTIWDGGGQDTYDFSGYTDNLAVDLAPGAWSVLAEDQRAQLTPSVKALGNVYNALLYQGDPRSLIENAIGGDGNDTLFGNDADNRLAGGAGTNILDGRGGFDTAVISAALTDITYSFEGRHLGFERPDESGDLTIRIEAFAFEDGTVIRDDGNALLDDLYYYTENHDIWLAGADAEAHYAASGWREGRDPNAFFSTATYLAMNPDVAAAGIDPLQHYREFGWKELRDPSAAFDTGAYLARYADVAAAGINPLEHYLAHGQAEGRQVSPVVGELNVIGFDASYYLLSNLDVLRAGLDPWSHYAAQGWREGRDPNAYFDTSRYLQDNPDVAAAGMDPLQHYHESGWREGRSPSDRFDGAAYLAAYADIAEGQYDPLLHFLKYGRDEGRMAFADLVG